MTAPPQGDRGLARDVVILACALSSGVHAGLVPEHLHDSPSLGASFVLASLLTGLAAFQLSRSDAAWPPAAAAVLLAGLLVAYATSVRVGLSALGGERESLDTLGAATKVIELAGFVAAVRLCQQSTRPAGGLLAERRIKEVRST